ncbi:MAG: DUF4118 domain-containing protein [Acidobacteriales bacterium]|nr:DUF4118 domain-containing protein [Terriglobales bacterium]
MTPTLSALTRYAIATAGVVCVIVFYTRVVHVNPTTVALTLLLVVLVVAANFRLKAAIYSAALSTLAFNFFFLPPIGKLTIADPQNWAALTAFLFVAVIASQLSDRARSQATQARMRQIEVERLYGFSQQLLLYEQPRELLKNAPKLVSESFGSLTAALYLSGRDKLYRYGDSDAITADKLREVARREEPFSDPNAGISIVPIRLGLRAVGAFGLSGDTPTPSTLDAISSLLAAAIERANALDSLAHEHAARESERLRSALLDSVTHELRTPLTSIKAAVTTLRAGVHLDPAAQAELLEVIEQETDRLNRLVSEAVEMARLDAYEVKLDLQPQSLASLVENAVQEARAVNQRHPVEVRVPADLPPVLMDTEWIGKVLHHLLENAAKYSDPGTPIFVSAEARDGYVVTSVADRGIGIDDLERSMIFDKFYRGERNRISVEGTGMGLAIVKAIVDAHHGKVDVTSQLGHGSVFSFSLPRATRETAATA